MRTNTYALYQWGQGKIYIINGYSLGHFYKKIFLTNIGYSLGHFYKKCLSQIYATLWDTSIKNFLANIKKLSLQIYIYINTYVYIYIFILAWHNIKWCKSSEVKTILLQKIEVLFSY